MTTSRLGLERKLKSIPINSIGPHNK